MTTIGNERLLALSDQRDWTDRGLAFAGIKQRLLTSVDGSGWLDSVHPKSHAFQVTQSRIFACRTFLEINRPLFARFTFSSFRKLSRPAISCIWVHVSAFNSFPAPQLSKLGLYRAGLP